MLAASANRLSLAWNIACRSTAPNEGPNRQQKAYDHQEKNRYSFNESTS